MLHSDSVIPLSLSFILYIAFFPLASLFSRLSIHLSNFTSLQSFCSLGLRLSLSSSSHGRTDTSPLRHHLCTLTGAVLSHSGLAGLSSTLTSAGDVQLCAALNNVWGRGLEWPPSRVLRPHRVWDWSEGGFFWVLFCFFFLFENF